jgi:ADP-heptose:LPS heptosyltransferase
MKLSNKIMIDRLLGKLLTYCFIPLTRILGVLLRRDHSVSDDNVRSILVAKFMGLGSIVQAMPMLRALKRRYPRARIIFLTRRANQELFHHIVDVDEVLLIDDSSWFRLAASNAKAIRAMMGRRIDLYFDLELFSTYGALISLFSLARNRLGFICGQTTDYKAYLYTHLMYFNFQFPIRVCYLQLARMAHVAGDASWDLVPLDLDPRTVRIAQDQIEDVLGAKRGSGVLVFNVNASDLCLERRWPGERFAAAARHFAGKGYSILFVGSAAERSYVQSVVEVLDADEEVRGRVHNVAGAFGFSEFLAVLGSAEAVLTNDTGIMNFSYALGVPTLSLFGPCSSVVYHVESPNTRVLEKQVYCRPCIHHLDTPPCRGDNVCMRLITTDEVIKALTGLLDSTLIPEEPRATQFVGEDGAPLGVLRSRDMMRTEK